MLPSYKKLAEAFWEYAAATNNDGDPRSPEEEDVERAYAILESTGITNSYAVGY